MEAGRLVSIEVVAVAWDASTGTAVEQHPLEVAGPLDPTAVLARVERRFGDPTGTAHTAELGDDVPVGWTYPIEVDPELRERHPEALLLVIPYACFDDGARRELLVHHAEVQAAFAALAGALEDTGGDEAGRAHHEPFLADAPAERYRRLEHESPRLYHSDREGITLEVGGWLRRLLAEQHTYLVVEVGDRDRYVQFVTHDGTWLRGEVVGPSNVADHPLTTREQATILDIGWLPPDGAAGGGNYWMEWGDPDVGIAVDVEDAAELAAATLCLAFGPLDPAATTVTTGAARPEAR